MILIVSDRMVQSHSPNKTYLTAEVRPCLLKRTAQIENGELFKPLHLDTKNPSRQEGIGEEEEWRLEVNQSLEKKIDHHHRRIGARRRR